MVRDPASTRQYEAELVQNEADLGIYKGQIAELRKLIDVSRMQVGFGDQRFVEDAEAAGGIPPRSHRRDAPRRGGRGGQRRHRLRAAHHAGARKKRRRPTARLEAAFADIEARVSKRAAELRATLDSEVGKLAEYTRTLEGLDSEGRLVVGQVAMRNFQLVRDRLRNIVLRADVGVTEEAWELREEQLTRVRNLQLERSRSEQQLNEELREVLDDMGELEKPSGTPAGSSK